MVAPDPERPGKRRLGCLILIGLFGIAYAMGGAVGIVIALWLLSVDAARAEKEASR